MIVVIYFKFFFFLLFLQQEEHIKSKIFFQKISFLHLISIYNTIIPFIFSYFSIFSSNTKVDEDSSKKEASDQYV